MTNRAIDWLDRHKSLARKRDAWKTIWQELSDLLHPTRGGFTASVTAGQETTAEMYDSTPILARRGLATTISGLMMPSEADWFWMKAEDDAANDADGAKRWFDIVQTRMWDWIYDPTARFIQQSGAVNNDIATFGLGYLWTDENRARNGLSFRALHIGKVAIDENSDGVIDTACIEASYTARQAAQKWGEDKLGPKVREALNSTKQENRDKPFDFVQCLYPRHERDTRRSDNSNLPVASLTVCVADQSEVEESGYHEFPMACPRWEVYPGEVYPRGPGMVALPDSRTLQAMGKTFLIAGEKAADPPTWAVDDGMLSAVRTWPGGLTIVSAETVKDLRGPPLGVLDMGKNLPLTLEMQNAYREMVGSAFYKDVFNLPVDDRQKTATEIMERKQQFLRTVAPTLAQLESDYIGVTIRRGFGLMQRAGAFPPPPDELRNAKARFEFMSPVQQAKAHVDAAGLRAAFDFIAPMISVKPEMLDNFDDDEIARDMPDMFGFRQKWLKSIDKRDAMREARQQAMEAAQAMEAVPMAADAAQMMTKANANQAQADAAAQAPA